MSETDIPQFLNKTVFFAPIWTDRYEGFVSALSCDARYERVERDEEPQYMLPYITKIYKSPLLFSEFDLRPEHFPHLGMFTPEACEGHRPILEKVRLSCFATGCVFAEFHIAYEGFSPDEIADFSFRFKNAKNVDRDDPESTRMLDALEALMPAGADATVFFAASDFKYECKLFHELCLETSLPEAELARHLVHLRRGYHRQFPAPKFVGEYDMTFEPYDYDHWAGSQEGLVNIFWYTGDPSTDNFLKKRKPTHLSRNYRFMYLVLLNQRFSAINYLEKTSLANRYTRREKEALNQKTSFLKTAFSFSVVSDDQLYQTVYSKMYEILGIDRLLLDIHDNEEQVQMLQSHEMLENEKRTNYFLFAISTLSLFSVLTDAASYFDRLPILSGISTALSMVCLFSILVSYCVWWLRYQKK